jgi:hypothetical protein
MGDLATTVRRRHRGGNAGGIFDLKDAMFSATTNAGSYLLAMRSDQK